ncbi:hypothetical protein EUZ85_15905 [Hahella sp. KA22]|uniref:hypothetical protein n=1 Tax=Hahella sp. KA22 TaxID=1628392 RepID=UPI000FDEFCB7|nr:hypothetical protein [Hahella sp. KA22]AZZ92129.1 hypothetical protein ENC22_13340 [Hahella sp. KA22]QAY55500.1 hypothetical protein EUZ85_15905 [Hahella sp. KA22]
MKTIPPLPMDWSPSCELGEDVACRVLKRRLHMFVSPETLETLGPLLNKLLTEISEGGGER